MSQRTGKSSEYTERRMSFRLPPFHHRCHVYVTNDLQRCVDGIGRKGGFTVQVMPNSGALTVCKKGMSDIYVLLPEGLGVGSVTHESTHVTHHVLVDSGVQYEEEVLAYMMGYVSERIGQFLWYGKKEEKDGVQSERRVLSRRKTK